MIRYFKKLGGMWYDENCVPYYVEYNTNTKQEFFVHKNGKRKENTSPFGLNSIKAYIKHGYWKEVKTSPFKSICAYEFDLHPFDENKGLGKNISEKLPETITDLNKIPIEFVRLDDGERFTLNDDGKTYSNERMKKTYPNHLHMEYHKEVFYTATFKPVYGVAVRYFMHSGKMWKNKKIQNGSRYYLKYNTETKQETFVYENGHIEENLPPFGIDAIMRHVDGEGWKEIEAPPFNNTKATDKIENTIAIEDIATLFTTELIKDKDIQFVFDIHRGVNGNYRPFLKMSYARRRKLVEKVLDKMENNKK